MSDSRPGGEPPGGRRSHDAGRQYASASALALRLVIGLAVVAAAAIAAGTLVDNVTDGDGVVALDHPVARFVAAHRTVILTSVMKAISAVGSPLGMTVLAACAGLALTVTRRSWTPLAATMVTAAGVIGLAAAVKTVLGRPRPPLSHAVVAADGFGFPSAHAAAAAAVCGTVAWLLTARMRSYPGRIAVWAAAATLAALVGVSRVYLGVHWTTDVLGGWAFGILWAAVVVSAWTAYRGLSAPRT